MHGIVNDLMPVYRYSAEGIERIARKARSQSLMTNGVALAAGIFVASIGMPEEIRLPGVAFATVGFGALLYWTHRRAVDKVRQAARSAEFEIEGEQLTARVPTVSAAIQRNEVSKVRYLQDGILVCGRTLDQSVQLKPELEQFEELTRRLEEWVPAGVPRVRTPGTVTRWSSLLVLFSIGLLVVGVTVQNPAIAIPCCVGEAILLAACVFWIWRSKIASRKIKWTMLIALVIAASLLSRAYSLWTRVG